MSYKAKIKEFIYSIMNSYSQIFFSENKVFAGILILVSFMDIWAGVFGILSVLTANTAAYVLGFNANYINKGIYGFNSLLIGLGIGLIFQPDLILFVIVIFTALFSLFITLALQGILTKYGLPFLSIPFLIGIWTVLLASGNFESLGLSERGIFAENELYASGGKALVDFFDYINNIKLFESVKIYFLSLGAIFFQYNILAGFFICIGMLYFSRIAFMLSLTGFYSAFFFYQLMGADFIALGYTYIGFNYILTSIAVGSYFLLPTYKSFIWSVLLLPIVVIISAGISEIFNGWSLSVYSLPFNITVILFIYILKLRVIKRGQLIDYFIKQSNPEKTVYLNKTAIEENKKKLYYPVGLPFWGTWSVMQAHNGEYTHKQEWRHAWDFVITDNDDKQFKNAGNKLDDYYCYSKSVLSPGDGLIANIYDGVDDNKPGEINTQKNWGNSIVIQHTEYLYTQISHLKKGSIKVKKGDYVKKGDIIALVGNSGHSPYPHIHFQMQATPHIGSYTIDYPISNYFLNATGADQLISFGKPEMNQKLTPPEPDALFNESFTFIPGQTIAVQMVKDDEITKHQWKIEKTIYNETYIYCKQTNSKAYFYSSESSFNFQNFYGSQKSALFLFFKSVYSLKKFNCKDLKLETSIRPDLFFKQPILFLQDFISPIYLFLKTKYTINYLSKKDDLSIDSLFLKTSIQKTIFNKETKTENYKLTITAKGQIKIESEGNHNTVSITINTNDL
jgi:urea transporter